MDEYPNVTWTQVRDHVVKELYIDEEWLFEPEGRDALSWWPWFLEQAIFVDDAGLYEDDESGDNWLRIVVRTHIAECNEESAIPLLQELNSTNDFGAYYWDEDKLTLSSAFVVNPLNVSMLKLLHTHALIQATEAHRVAKLLFDKDGFGVLASEHPVNGFRDQPDSLLTVYGGEEMAIESIVNTWDLFQSARPEMIEIMTSFGWQVGFEGDDVVFFNNITTSCDLAIGIRADDRMHVKYGPGLFVYARVLADGDQFDASECNVVNRFLALETNRAVFGPILGRGVLHEDMGSRLETFIPMAYLARVRQSDRDYAIAVTNVASHAAGVVHAVQHFVGIPPFFVPADQ